MSLLISILLLLGGMLLLISGGELLVRNAIALSRLSRVSPAVIGLTIVAAATSLPELAVSLLAAAKGSPDVAVGNVIGSNIFNLAVILGLTAVFFPPLRFREHMTRMDVAVMALSAILLFAVSRDGVVSRVEGFAFITMLVVFLVYRTRHAREADIPGSYSDEEAVTDELSSFGKKSRGVAPAIVLILVAAGLLTAGADVLVRGAVGIARLAGLSERVIAITLVSAGTGLPELVTAIMAGVRKHAAVAVGNVIGSNIFNVFGIMGTVSLVHPIGVSKQLANTDMLWMLCFCFVAIIPVLKPSRRISRFEGSLAVGAYVVYIARLL